FNGSTFSLLGVRFSFCRPGCSAAAIEAGSVTATIAIRTFRIAPFIAARPILLADELDAERLSAVPDHFAIPPGAGVARECQPEPAGQHAGILEGDLGSRTRDIVYHTRAGRKAAIKGDPPGLTQRFARFPLSAWSNHRVRSLRPASYLTGL